MATGSLQQLESFLSLTTPLGERKLALLSFAGHEAISRLFQFQLDLISDDPAISFTEIIGRNITIGVGLADKEEQQFFNGFVSRFAQIPGEGHLARYRAEMVPWLWFLTRTTNCRIYQNLTVPEILEQVFREFGFQDYEFRFTGTYDRWEYCVQYRETAFNFVSRLMEQEGIFYFFEHQDGKHTLVLGDSPSAHRPCPHHSETDYVAVGDEGYAREEDAVFTWKVEQQLRPGKCALTDYNFETPSSSLFASVDSRSRDAGNTRWEIFDYPGEYEKRDQGDSLVKLRMEEEETSRLVAAGESSCRSFMPGFKFELSGHPRNDQNGSYVLTSVTHSAREGGYYTGPREASEGSYRNTFTAIPAAVPFRPARVTRKPLVQGPQTAVVVGPAGEEIYTDNYSRVKVQFHWDRLGQHNENSSCWIRVAQPWAGANWGGIAIPRIGQEVVVDFLEGDPDRPLITGRVYNAAQMPPYELPANQTQTGIKSRSSKGGGAENFNELRFEDKKGSEEIYLHAEKNWTIVTENDKNQNTGHDESLLIGHDRSKTVRNNETTGIGKNRTETVGENETITIGKDRTETVGGYEKITIAKDRTETVVGDESVTIGKNRTGLISDNDTLTVGASRTETITRELTISAGLKVSISAGVELTLTGPGGMVKIDASGVTVQGVLVKIN